MLWAITFLCLRAVVCEMTPDMSNFDMITFVHLEDCQSVARRIALSEGASVGCVDQKTSIVDWIYAGK
jgi:hypothetical protein